MSTETCEVVTRWEGHVIAESCGKPATHRYAAMGGGFMHLCADHAEPHKKYAEPISSPTPEQREA
jgi:hypothetical protein